MSSKFRKEPRDMFFYFIFQELRKCIVDTMALEYAHVEWCCFVYVISNIVKIVMPPLLI